MRRAEVLRSPPGWASQGKIKAGRWTQSQCTHTNGCTSVGLQQDAEKESQQRTRPFCQNKRTISMCFLQKNGGYQNSTWPHDSSSPAEIKVPLNHWFESWSWWETLPSLALTANQISPSLLSSSMSNPSTGPTVSAALQDRQGCLLVSSHSPIHRLCVSFVVCVCVAFICIHLWVCTVAVHLSLCLSCPLSPTCFIWRQKRSTLAPFFTYGNSPLSPTHLSMIPCLVSHGLPCSSFGNAS